MMKRVRVILAGVEAIARVHEEAAPETVARFWAALPIKTRLRHVRWSGSAGYILIRQIADKTQPLENAINFYPPGSIAFRAEHGETAFSYGEAQARDHTHAAAWCHLGTLETKHRRVPDQGRGHTKRRRQADAPDARGGAVKRVEIEIEGVVAEGESNEAGAPHDGRLLGHAADRGAARALHMVGLGLRAAAAEPPRRARARAPGLLDLSADARHPAGSGEVLISYGAAEYRSVSGVEYGTRIGRVVQNRDALLDVLARMHDEGDKRIAIRRAGTT